MSSTNTTHKIGAAYICAKYRWYLFVK